MRLTKTWIVVAIAAFAMLVGALVYVFVGRAPRFDPAPLENYYRLLSVRPAQPVDLERVRGGILAAASYIKRANLDSGQFTYLVNTNPAIPVIESYSLLRHAGAVYALGMANASFPDPEAVAVMKRAVDFMRRCCFTQFDNQDMLGIWEPEKVVRVAGPPEYKLGGAGLGLAALVSLANASPDSVPVDEMRRLARFGQFLQRHNGEFYSKYVPSRGGAVLPGAALYYPGEMALGWLMLYEREPAAELIQSSVAALVFLANERARSGAAPADHWALLATAKLFQIASRRGIQIPRQALIDHTLQICHTMLEEADGPARMPAMEGTLVSTGHGEVTPTSTRLEGLLGALTFLPPSHPMTAHVAAAVERGTSFLVRAQLKDGPYAGGFPNAVSTLPDDGTTAVASFNAQATEVRIDYVQHAMSAMVEYLRQRGNPANAVPSIR